jgi:hypothetical protein
MSNKGNKLEHMQQKFAALFYTNFISHVYYNYVNALYHLKLHTFYSINSVLS